MTVSLVVDIENAAHYLNIQYVFRFKYVFYFASIFTVFALIRSERATHKHGQI